MNSQGADFVKDAFVSANFHKNSFLHILSPFRLPLL